MYTSINKLNSSVNEGTEQMTSYILNIKKKLNELKKSFLHQDVTADAASKNSELVKLQQKMRSLKVGKGKEEEIKEVEKKIEECSNDLQNLVTPNATQNQKAVICRNIVGIVDTLGQVAFRTLSDQFAVRDSIKIYLISVVDAVKLGGGKKEKKEEKGTIERMSIALIKSAGIFLEFGKHMGLEFPTEYETQIKVGTAPTGPTIADLTKSIDTQVRALSHVTRNERGIELDTVDRLLQNADELLNTMKKVDTMNTSYHAKIHQAVKESQAAICVAEYEADPAAFKIPPVRSLEEAASKLKIMTQVLHEYLVPSLVATPLVYLQDKDWVMKSHSDFRATRRKELKDLEPHITPTMPLDALRECIIEFSQVYIHVLHVKIPAMMEVYPDDTTILTRVKWGVERQNLRDEVNVEIEKLQNPKTKNNPNSICLVIQDLIRIMMRFLTFKPIGRPHVFRSDAEWKLVSESKLRFKLRKDLLL